MTLYYSLGFLENVSYHIGYTNVFLNCELHQYYNWSLLSSDRRDCCQLLADGVLGGVKLAHLHLTIHLMKKKR